jgi:hypothetical protein
MLYAFPREFGLSFVFSSYSDVALPSHISRSELSKIPQHPGTSAEEPLYVLRV